MSDIKLLLDSIHAKNPKTKILLEELPMSMTPRQAEALINKTLSRTSMRGGDMVLSGPVRKLGGGLEFKLDIYESEFIPRAHRGMSGNKYDERQVGSLLVTVQLEPEGNGRVWSALVNSGPFSGRSVEFRSKAFTTGGTAEFEDVIRQIIAY